MMSNMDVQTTSSVTMSSGPVAGVEAMTYNSAAPIQQARQEPETVRHRRATGPFCSSWAQTVMTASAIPIANHATKRGSHNPRSGWCSGMNMMAV